MKTACVIPVTWFAAYEWLTGELDDAALLLKAPLRPEGVFLVNFTGRTEYKRVLANIRHWVSQGATFLIARTGNPVVDRHMVDKNQCLRCHLESRTESRLLCPPAAFQAWCRKCRLSSPSPALKRAATAT